MNQSSPISAPVMTAYEELSQHLLDQPAGYLLDPSHPALAEIVSENGRKRGAYMIGTLLTLHQHAFVAQATFPARHEDLPPQEQIRSLAYISLLHRALRLPDSVY